MEIKYGHSINHGTLCGYIVLHFIHHKNGQPNNNKIKRNNSIMFKNNSNTHEKLQKMGNTFLYAQEMSAQYASFICLSLLLRAFILIFRVLSHPLKSLLN